MGSSIVLDPTGFYFSNKNSSNILQNTIFWNENQKCLSAISLSTKTKTEKNIFLSYRELFFFFKRR